MRPSRILLVVAEAAWILTFLAVGVGAAPVDPILGESSPSDLTFGYGVKDLVVVTIGGASITATAGHPFWVEGLDAWVDAGDLQRQRLL